MTTPDVYRDPVGADPRKPLPQDPSHMAEDEAGGQPQTPNYDCAEVSFVPRRMFATTSASLQRRASRRRRLVFGPYSLDEHNTRLGDHKPHATWYV